MSIDKPAVRPNNPRFSSGPCTKHPGWSVEALKGALVGRYHRSAEAKARLELAIERTAELLEASGRLPRGDRAGVGHRRGGDGAVVAARRPRRRRARLGGVQPRLGHRYRRAAQAQGRPRVARALWRAARSHPSRLRPRRGVRLERHDLGRARAECRLDRQRPRGADHLRCDLGGVRARDRLAEARCGDLLLAEGARRRGAARHADPEPPRRSSGWKAIRRPGRCRSCSA